MRLNYARFNQLAHKLGQRIQWRQAHTCPCSDPETGRVDYHCPACQGRGVIWDSAQAGQLALSGQKLQRQWAALGLYERGDVVCTLPSDDPVYDLAEFARVLFTDSSKPFSALLNHGGSDNVGPGVQRLDEVLWLDSGVIERADPTPALDTATGALSWAGVGNEPAAGTRITVSGRRSPEYYCYMEFPQDRSHQQGDPLPRRVVLRRLDLFGRD